MVQAMVDIMGEHGARAGIIWIGILACIAVFAPFLASSFPVALQLRDGSWEFPLFHNLRSLDLLLVVSFMAGIFLAVFQRRASRRPVKIAAGVVAIAALLAPFIPGPPQNIVWENYRVREVAGEFTKVYHAPVPYSANDRMRDHPEDTLQPPSARHWLGTTVFGEDMLSRMIHASRVALTIGILATVLSVVIGIIAGGLMGYFAGWTDLLGMRVTEMVEAIPRLILLLIITSFFGRSIYLMMTVIGLLGWTGNARFIRAEFLKLRNQDFVQAGIAAGLPLRSILFRHMLPNAIAPVLVEASFGIAGAILLESVLSFLGLGLAAEDPSWGQLLNQARSSGTGFNWWIATFPGLAIFLTVFAYILVGEALRDALDPKLRGSSRD